MKKLEALIRPEALDAVKDALATLGVNEVVVCEVERCGPSVGRRAVYRGAEYVLDSPGIKIEVVLDDRLAARAALVVRSSSASGHHDDAVVLLLPVDKVLGLRCASPRPTGRLRAVMGGGVKHVGRAPFEPPSPGGTFRSDRAEPRSRE